MLTFVLCVVAFVAGAGAECGLRSLGTTMFRRFWS